MVRVKICGLKTIEDVKTAVMHGANALGFIFAESKRKVDPEKVKKIIRQLPPFVTAIGVFVNEELSEVQKIAEYCRLDAVQLHGEESPEYCQRLPLNIIKGFRIKNEESIKEMEPYQGFVQGFLLDTYKSGVPGGTGETFDWSLAKNAAYLGPIVLAGGLNPQNVSEAINLVNPYAVDVSSGVETEGIKDAVKIKTFMEAVRRNNL